MAAKKATEAKPVEVEPAEAQDNAPEAPSEDERQGMRAHDENGNVRPADGRWELHAPEDESKHVKTELAE